MICWRFVMIFGIKPIIALLCKESICQSIFDKILLKTKIMPYSKTTDFHNRIMFEVDYNYISWSVIFIDSVLKKDKIVLK